MITPEKYREAKFEKCVETEVIRKLREFPTGENCFLVISGIPDTGKSFGLYALRGYLRENEVTRLKNICACSADDGYERWVKTPIRLTMKIIGPDFFAKVMTADFDEKDDLMYYVVNAKLLGIDDLGVEKNSEYNQSLIEQIINHRYENLLPTIITTNLSAKDFCARYSERVIRRIRELSGGEIMECHPQTAAAIKATRKAKLTIVPDTPTA